MSNLINTGNKTGQSIAFVRFLFSLLVGCSSKWESFHQYLRKIQNG